MTTFSRRRVEDSGLLASLRSVPVVAAVLGSAMSFTSGRALAIDPCPSNPVVLGQATATFSQLCFGPYLVSRIIDGNPTTGWAIYENCSSSEASFNQTAVVECVSDMVSPVPGQPFVIDVSLLSGFNSSQPLPHALGLFRLSVTGDSRTTFADGLSAGGDVTANWVVLTPYSVSASATNNLGVQNNNAAATLTVQPDSSILAGGPLPEYNRYRILALSPLAVVTGVRIEVIDANGTSNAAALGLPTGGPGRATNGNFILFDMGMGVGRCLDICQQPAATITCPGGAATFSVVAGGAGPFTYQWRANGTPVNTIANPSAATATLLLTAVASSASYDCIITNACGNTTSSSAQLNVCPANFNCDTVVDFNDYLDFVDALATQSPAADFNSDTIIDFNDYLDFVDAFSIGC